MEFGIFLEVMHEQTLLSRTGQKSSERSLAYRACLPAKMGGRESNKQETKPVPVVTD